MKNKIEEKDWTIKYEIIELQFSNLLYFIMGMNIIMFISIIIQ